METWKLGLGMGAVVAALLAIMACSSGSSGGGGGTFSCGGKGNCPNDTAPTQMQIDQCNALMNDTMCGAKYVALGDCYFANATCDATTGKSTVDQSQCSTQSNAYSTCLASELLDGGFGG